METQCGSEISTEKVDVEGPFVLEEIVIEELAIDGICGVY